MGLPSQSARSQNYAGRSFSSHRRRRSKFFGLVAFVGALLVLAGLVYGGLWVFGVVGGNGSGEGLKSVAGAGGTDDDLLPSAMNPKVIEQGQPIAERGTIRPNGQGAKGPTGYTPTEDVVLREDTPARRNLLREGLEASRQNEETGVVTPMTRPERDPLAGTEKDGAGEVLGTDNGGSERPTSGVAAALAARIGEADQLIKNNEPLEARLVLNAALSSPRISARDAEALRAKLGALNADLVFSPRVTPNDPMCEVYEIQSGDRLSKISQKRELATHWKLIQRVNGMSNPNRIRVGQKLKLVRGPFHAVVHKGDYRLDIYHGSPESPENWIYIRSFDVGLGKEDGTPLGTFIVARNSKVENPAWVNPRNPSERYAPNDPENPIGDYWLGLEGLGDSASFVGYGLHGTIEPDSIGEQASLGCVRLNNDDIEQVFELLEEGVSVVKIVR